MTPFDTFLLYFIFGYTVLSDVITAVISRFRS